VVRLKEVVLHGLSVSDRIRLQQHHSTMCTHPKPSTLNRVCICMYVCMYACVRKRESACMCVHI